MSIKSGHGFCLLGTEWNIGHVQSEGLVRRHPILLVNRKTLFVKGLEHVKIVGLNINRRPEGAKVQQQGVDD